MTLSVSISTEAEAKLRQRAAAEGKEPTAYASQILEEAITSPTLDELLTSVRADFAASGMSERDIMDLGREELNALRRDRKADRRCP